jgi:succinate-acetate transporter protein
MSNGPPASPSVADPAPLGLAGFALTTFVLSATTLSRPVLIVFVLLTITFFVLAIATFASQPGITVLGGYLGLLAAIAAWYASARILEKQNSLQMSQVFSESRIHRSPVLLFKDSISEAAFARQRCSQADHDTFRSRRSEARPR